MPVKHAAFAVLTVLLILPPQSTAWPAWMEAAGSRVFSSARKVSNQQSSFDLLLLHTNDMHARFEQTNRLSGVCSQRDAENGKCYGGFARIATVIRNARAAAQAGTGPPVLALNAGDTFQGSLYFTLFRADIVAPFVNLLNFDALTLGNHEFDDGPKGLAPFLKDLKSPIVAANVDISKSEAMKGIDLPPSVVLDVEGRKIGIIGYLASDTNSSSSPQDVIITDEIVAIRKEAKRLTNDGIKIIIGLGHSGYLFDIEMAKKIPELDLIVSAHSHTFLFNDTAEKIPDNDVPVGMYPTVVTHRSGKKIPIIQAYAFTKYIGRLLVTFDADGNLIRWSGNPILLNKNVPEDVEVLAELEIWKQKLDYFTHKKEGNTTVVLDSSDCQYKECNIGNLVTDAFVHYRASQFVQNNTMTGWTDAPIAYINSGCIRNSIDARPNDHSIFLRDLIDVMPFGNIVTMVKLRGEWLLEMLEQGVRRYDVTLADNRGSFPQLSGLQVTYNVRNPVGQRVVKVLARCAECEVPAYFPVDPNQTYTLLVNSFIANGGNGYSMIAKGEIKPLDETDTNVLINYVNSHSPIFPEVSQRITVINSAMSNYIDVFCILPTVPLTLLSFVYTHLEH